VKPPRLFDASALLNLILAKGGEALEPIADGGLLDLTLYEVGNSVWKLVNVRRRLSLKEAQDLLSLVEKLTARMMMVTYSGLRLLETLQIAVDESMTFYDAAYVEAARSLKLTLVTDDKRLHRAASKHVDVTSSDAI